MRIHPIANGIELRKPNNAFSDDFSNQTVDSLLKMPCSIYFENTEGIIQQLNEQNVELCGFDSAKSAIGKSYFDKFNSLTGFI